MLAKGNAGAGPAALKLCVSCGFSPLKSASLLAAAATGSNSSSSSLAGNERDVTEAGRSSVAGDAVESMVCVNVSNREIIVDMYIYI